MLIECDADTYAEYINDDPVRRSLFEDNRTRFKGNFRVYADVDKDTEGFGFKVNAIVCVVVCPFLPQTEEQLRLYATGELGVNEGELGVGERTGIILCPYSLWSYSRGAGKRLLNDLLECAPVLHPDIDHVITMSPPTQMAMHFHVGNGAVLLSPNTETINYAYEIPDHGFIVH
jgi:hypothetical protein